MNDRNLVLEKLELILEHTLVANDEFKRAALYGALNSLIKDLIEEDVEYSLGLSENIERVRWSISALLHYDINNGHGSNVHYTWALGAIKSIRAILKQREH